MPERNVVLSAGQETMIESLIESGRFANASDVVREGLRLIERRESDGAEKLKILRAAVQVGIDDLECGNFEEFSDPENLTAYMNGVLARATSRTKPE